MTTRLTEDDLYRTSTQYRLWSFSPEQLATQRRKTHELALARARQHAPRPAGEQPDGNALEYLSEEEELRLVQRYCDLIRTTSDHLKWPNNIKATAVQYLKRFYLSNSCMTYPPKEIYKTILFLASKTEALHIDVNRFASSISADADAILAPEYKVMQALRFTLDVRQPTRGLKGVLMELLNMRSGMVGKLEGSEKLSGEAMQQALLTLPPPSEHNRTPWKPPRSPEQKDVTERIQVAYHTARGLLDGPVSLTDVYFLYTPSQILLAAMHVADASLTAFYLDTKLPHTCPTRPKILTTIHDCAAIIAAFDAKSGMSKDERAALEKKLDACRDPTTKDLVKSHAAMKRGGDVDEEEVKKKKLAREKDRKEMDDVFGPSLGKKTNDNA